MKFRNIGRSTFDHSKLCVPPRMTRSWSAVLWFPQTANEWNRRVSSQPGYSHTIANPIPPTSPRPAHSTGSRLENLSFASTLVAREANTTNVQASLHKSRSIYHICQRSIDSYEKKFIWKLLKKNYIKTKLSSIYLRSIFSVEIIPLQKK